MFPAEFVKFIDDLLGGGPYLLRKDAGVVALAEVLRWGWNVQWWKPQRIVSNTIQEVCVCRVTARYCGYRVPRRLSNRFRNVLHVVRRKHNWNEPGVEFLIVERVVNDLAFPFDAFAFSE